MNKAQEVITLFEGDEDLIGKEIVGGRRLTIVGLAGDWVEVKDHSAGAGVPRYKGAYSYRMPIDQARQAVVDTETKGKTAIRLTLVL